MTHYIVVLLLFGTIICRGGSMDACTPLRARLQHWLPLPLAAAGLPIFPPTHVYAVELLGAAILAFLWMERRSPHCPRPSGGQPHGRSDSRRSDGAEQSSATPAA